MMFCMWPLGVSSHEVAVRTSAKPAGTIPGCGHDRA